MDLFEKELTTATQHGRYPVNQIFDDFLTCVTCALSLGRQEELYHSTLKRYNEKTPEHFGNCLGALIWEMTKEPFSDVLGSFYEEHISLGHNGQFFTPEHLSGLLAGLSGVEENTTISDPACGSGRSFLAHAKQMKEKGFSNNCEYTGQDIDHRCVKMTVVNMALNSLKGKVILGDTLSMVYTKVYSVSTVVPGVVIF